MTETTNRGKIFYDGTCRFCTEGIARLRPWLKRCDVTPVPFENGAAEEEMLLRWHDGRTFGGADAAIFLAQQFWFLRPLAFLAGLPGIHSCIDAIYRRIARNRQCLNGACAIDLSEPKPSTWPGWTLLFVLISGATSIGFAFAIPAWLWMWTLAGALWIGFKVMAFWSKGGLRKVSPLFFAWIGTDADAFRYDPALGQNPNLGFVRPIVFLLFGAALILFALPLLTHPIAIGWVGVIAMLCVCHFGSFAILALLWQRMGFAVEPIMKAPWSAKTLAEFWGPRWNRAFSDWARVHIFRPLVRRLGIARGTGAGFLASGFAHELVISLPARAGFGLPTLYFLIQAGVVLLQRKYGFLQNRWFTLTMVLLPAPILFHPTFIENVFAPMMELLTRN